MRVAAQGNAGGLESDLPPFSPPKKRKSKAQSPCSSVTKAKQRTSKPVIESHRPKVGTQVAVLPVQTGGGLSGCVLLFQ